MHLAHSAFSASTVTLLALAMMTSLVVFARDADADADAKPAATMQCDRAGEPGRVRCSVDAFATAGRSITWAEVEVVTVPELATALRGRFGPQDAASRDPAHWRFALALAAKRVGRGEVTARVRLVECTDDKRCFPREARVATEMVVGAP